MIVFSCGASRNVNLKNFAKSYWCGLIIAVIVIFIVLLIALIVVGVSGADFSFPAKTSITGAAVEYAIATAPPVQMP